MTIFKSPVPLSVAPRDDLTIPQFVLDGAEEHPTRPIRPAHVPCLIDDESGRMIHMEEVRKRSNDLARALKGQWNIGPGDVVSLYSPNHVDYGVIIWAVHKLGGIISCVSSIIRSEKAIDTYQIRIASPVLLFAHSENLSTARDALQKFDSIQIRLALVDDEPGLNLGLTSVNSLIQESNRYPSYVEHKLGPGKGKSTIAFLCYSSGTTGNPKAVAISHYNVIANLVQVATFNGMSNDTNSQSERFRPGDVCAGGEQVANVNIYGLVVNLHLMVYAGMTNVIFRRFNFKSLLESIERHRITHLMIVPPQVVLFCKHPLTKRFDLSSVRFCMVAAAPLSADMSMQLQQVFPGAESGQGYGTSSCRSFIPFFPLHQRVGTLGGCGQLLPGTLAKLVKADGNLAGVGEPGELYLQGPQVTLGYFGNEQATADTFVDGWFRTGDQVLFDENGDMFVTDRIKELIKVKGNQVAPSELEGYLLSHESVADAAVIGIPDDYAGELPIAFVVLKPDVAAHVTRDVEGAKQIREELYKHISGLVSRYKWLDGGIEFVELIPKSPSGKILRRVLAERIRAVPRARL
ncbi:phenylacetyl-CoA ligase [Polyporus arcularius HHB13444]|uniref:Phenylacetyl-CoA ligase n=1 Tax=Polyporus arcularius HHB13444 TaxID=1314778 RepID=A0A5C3PPV6_9APHY|nr:phenylacetyl-CoA ligase [Polyporus arcularius HHB13444]